jgi:hypothetical protein
MWTCDRQESLVLTERNRAVLHRRLTEVVGDEEAVSEMLSNFPNDERLRSATEASLSQTESRLEAHIEARMAQQTTQLVIWMVGTAIALAAVILTAIGIWA